MGKIVPKGRAERLAWFRYHREKWAEHAAELGFSPEQIAQFRRSGAVMEDAHNAGL